MNSIESIGLSAAPDKRDEARLARAARQLEGVFVEQLFKSMRDTVPTDGLTGGGAGEQMFAGMLDQRVSELVPEQWSSTIGDALMTQFRRQGQPRVTPEVPQ